MELSTQAALVIAGVALVISGFLGVGIRFGTIILPKLEGWKQAVLVAVGILLIALGVSLTPEFYTTLWIRMPAATPTFTATPLPAVVAVAPTVQSTDTPFPPIAAATPTTVATQPPSLPTKFIVDEAAYLRSGPGTTYEIVAGANGGQEFDLITKSPDGLWLQVCCIYDRLVWIFGELGHTTEGDIEVAANLPVPPVAAGDTPVPNATATPASQPTNTQIPNTAVIVPVVVAVGSKPEPSDPPTKTPTATSTVTPTDTPTATVTGTPTETPTETPTDTPTPVPDSQGMDMGGWCQSLGHQGAFLTGNDVYSWRCQTNDGSETGLDLFALCRETYGEKYQPQYGDFNDPYTWRCVASN